MKPITFLGLFIISLMSNFSFGQSDTLVTEKDSIHSVRKATILSAVLPGAGQVYNHFAQPKGKKKAFWKVPLIYAGLGLTGFSIIQNQSDVISLRKEYRLRESCGGTPTDWLAYDSGGLLILEQQSAGFRDYSILGFILIYGIQVADAAVEAHFVNFDISPDLSMHISPWTYQSSHAGISMSFNFR